MEPFNLLCWLKLIGIPRSDFHEPRQHFHQQVSLPPSIYHLLRCCGCLPEHRLLSLKSDELSSLGESFLMRFEIHNIQVNAMDEALNVTELISLSLVRIRKPFFFRQKKNLQQADQKYLTYDAPTKSSLDFPGWI